MSIKERQNEVIDEFAMFDDWMDKYEYIISLGKELPLIDEGKKVEKNIIKGCQSRVWLDAQLIDGKVRFTADSDAIITKGIISLMIRVLDDSSPEEIVNEDLYFIDEIGLKEHLSPTRSNGLVSMVKQMKMYALAFQTQLKNG
ncbi:MAG: Fe-S metabolism protein SufE [Flavobacteriales bacterium]|nr:Fe-S metabolism protein SufE [Flavobacteriales bacterium]|tara:strand:+ start:1163 stop:1591 length:429 start_codon:yes stop_codon:yes gene_type:complete